MRVSRERAAARDETNPLAPFRDRFVIPDPDLIYLDGNSLGRMPKTTAERLAAALDEWAGEVVRGWDRWIELPGSVGDRLAAHVLGARPGEVVVTDSTTVNLYKLAAAALAATPTRPVVVVDRDEFPTDRYVMEGLAEIRWASTVDDISAAVDDDVGLVCLSHVGFKSGAVADLATITERARRAGARVLWDLSHSAGILPIELTASGADLAVGCTYKYLHAGPGAPAYLYVRRELQEGLRSPIWGWFGQRDQFAMAASPAPADGIGRFLAGTPSVLGLMAVDEGARVVAEAGVDRIRATSLALTSLLMELADDWLEPLGFTVATPREAHQRGGHVALIHADAGRISVALRERAGVIADFRPPDILRLAPTPLDTRFVDVWDGVDRLRRLVSAGEQEALPRARRRVT